MSVSLDEDTRAELLAGNSSKIYLSPLQLSDAKSMCGNTTVRKLLYYYEASISDPYIKFNNAVKVAADQITDAVFHGKEIPKPLLTFLTNSETIAKSMEAARRLMMGQPIKSDKTYDTIKELAPHEMFDVIRKNV